MLQRAASNAYSWWWASHVRTKQTKWLEQSIQDMDEIMGSMRKLIQEDGDTFAKRAEMYYRRRPELISSVEEAHKQFRALADRYDLLSKELQNANHTIATVFPEPVQFGMSEEDGPIPKFHQNPQIPVLDEVNAPQVPKAPVKELENIISKVSKKYQERRSSRGHMPKVASGLTKEEALEEISKLQKDILALQTVKEFVKISYESGVAKYWGIENQIMEMQQRISRLQDEFDLDTVIEDDEARTLMAEAALKSCQEMLAVLEEKHEKSIEEARVEYERIEAAYQRLQPLRKKYMKDQPDDENLEEGNEARRKPSIDVDDLVEGTKGLKALTEVSKESLDLSSLSCLTVSELAEKIDQLVNKVISFETAVSLQTVLVNRLRSETNDLHAHIRKLEDENENLVDDTKNLSTRVKEVESKLNKVQDLNKSVESQNSNLHTNFAQARTNLDQLSEKLSSVRADEEEVEARTSPDHLPEELSKAEMDEGVTGRTDPHHLQEKPSNIQADENVEETDSAPAAHDKKDSKNMQSFDKSDKKTSDSESEDVEDVKEVQIHVHVSDSSEKQETKKIDTFLDQKLNENTPGDHSGNSDEAKGNAEKSDELNWQQMLLNGMEDGETILLKEYTAILKNYKDVKKKLGDAEKRERECRFDLILQMRELKRAIQKRDEEITSLRKKLNSAEADKDAKEDNTTLSSLLDSDANEDDDDKDNPDANEEDESKLIFIDQNPSVSIAEEKLRKDIDSILDENLDFWYRFSTAFYQVQKFKTEVKDLQDEISKIKQKEKPDGAFTPEMKSEVLPIYKHLREIQRELTVWLEQSAPLKDELENRFTSLCYIQEDITKALREGAEEEEIKFSSHQAAKLQGEILNMKQENNRVREELQAGLDHASMIRIQIEKTLKMLHDEFGISSDQAERSRNRIPLRSFLFGAKQKKQKNSIFSCMHPNWKHIRPSNNNGS